MVDVDLVDVEGGVPARNDAVVLHGHPAVAGLPEEGSGPVHVEVPPEKQRALSMVGRRGVELQPPGVRLEE
jgi:hypothetical protein